MALDWTFCLTFLIVAAAFGLLTHLYIRHKIRQFERDLPRRIEEAKNRPPKKSPFVSIDEDRITVRLQGKPALTIRWEEIEEVTIVTTSAGPASEDYWYVLDGAGENRVVIPASEADEFLHLMLQKLKGIDMSKMIESLGSTREAQFVIWTREK